MPLPFTLGQPGQHWPTVALTLALGAAGGAAGQAAGLPLPMLLGSLLAVAAAAILGARPLGHLPQFPITLRMAFIPVIGVSIGAAFRPEIVEEAKLWWPSLVALLLFLPAIHWLGYAAVRAAGKTDPVTTFLGTAPGGLIETVQLGEELGADVQMLTMLQFLRLILTIVLVPLGFAWMTGQAVGSAGGATMAGAGLPLTAREALVLLAVAVAGAGAAHLMRWPAAFVTGPLALSGAVHLAGWSEAAPPAALIAATQVVIGASLGVRFAGMPPGRIVAALRLSVLHVALTIAAAAAVAALLAPWVHEPATAVFLAFAPGGLAEMSLIALSLNVSVVYVTAHHVARIVLTIVIARLYAGRLRG